MSFFHNLDLLATKPWFTFDSWLTTRYITAEYPKMLASPKMCKSTELIGFFLRVNDLIISALFTIHDESRETYSVNRQNNFKTSMLRSSLCNYSDAYILDKGNISINNTAGAGADANNTNKKVIFKNCAPFTDCISKIDNTQVDNAKGIDIGMPMYNLIEYNDNYSIKSGSLWQYCKDIPPVNDNGNIVDFNGANATDSFNFKTKITG